MENESGLLNEVWEAMKEFLPGNTLNDAAVALVTAFTKQGIELEDLDGDIECPYIERAIDSLKEEEDPYSDDEEE